MFLSRRSEPPEDSCSHRTVPRPAGKALRKGRCDAGHGVPPPQPATGAARHPPFTTPRCRAGSAVRLSSKSPRGSGTRPARAGGGGGLRCAASRRLSTPAARTSRGADPRDAGILFPSRGPPRNLFCPHGRAPRGRHPRRHRQGARRLPGGCRGALSRRAAAGRAAAGAASAATFTTPSRGERCAGWRRGADGEP